MTQTTIKDFSVRVAAMLLVMLLTATTAWAQDVVEAIGLLTYNTAGGYYEIDEARDLADLATYVNGGHNAQGKTFKMTQDIVFTHTTAWNDAGSDENNYTAIGGEIDENSRPFSGHFDGQGHTISGIRIYKGGNPNDDRIQGLFGYIDGSTAEVKNVILADARITGYDGTGGIVGFNNNNGKITNCHVLSDVTIHTVQGNCYNHGGIVGHNSGTVTGCTSAASITSSADGSANYGGIAGGNNGGIIKDCLYLGNTVEGSLSVGGIVGLNHLNSSTVQNSYYTSTTIQGKDNLGNILDNANSAVGYNENGPVTNCGLVSSDDIAQSGDTYTIGTPRGWDTFCGMLYHNNTYNRFSGKTVKLGASISVTRMAGGDYHDFCGTFDGNQKTLTVSYGSADSPIDENNVAPFRNLQSYCIIKDLHVAGDIYTSGQFAGGLAGTMFGTVEIENCLVSTVIHSYTSGDGTHGGIVGHAGNNKSTNLTIEGCLFDGKLLTCGSTSTTNSSGFVGYKHNSGTVSITNSFYAPAALGTGETEITSGSATFMRNAAEGSITNCYYTRTLGDAQGNSYDGTCGTNVYYAYDSSTQTLNIFGTGAMTDYEFATPWYDYQTNITTVVIGNGVTSIGTHVFDGCSALTSITIPSSVISIGWNAFAGCSALTSIEIPASVEIIRNAAFMGCSALTSVTIGSGVTSIGTHVFDGCSALTSIEIPASVTSIGEQAFYNCDALTSVEIPASVTSIGDGAFYDCYNLASVTIYAPSLTDYGTNAFANNADGRKIYVYYDCVDTYKAKASTMGASQDDILPISDGTCGTNVNYSYDSNRKTLCIFGTGAMNNYSFGNNAPWNSDKANITTVVIGNGVTHIGNYAFYNCNGLTSITIPNSVTSIGNDAFNGCSALTSVTIPATIESIGVWAFGNCNSLTSIEIPASVMSIGLGAFAGCTSLASISVTSGNTKYHSDGNCIIETATKTLIAGCKNSVIPTGVTSIGNNAFNGCTGLTSITIPNSVTSIGDGAFYDCDALASIEIPNSVTSIGNNAFEGCTGLASIEIPNSVTSIGYEVFAYCSGLTSIEIPASVTSIGWAAFSDCTSLTSVTIYAPSLTDYGIEAFADNAYGRKIYVFSDCVETYKENASTMGANVNDILPIEGIALADAADNSALITAGDGATLAVTLQGRTLWKDGNWNTLCLPFDVTIADSPLAGDGVDVRTLSSTAFTGGKLTLNFTQPGAVTTLEAGKPYIIRWNNTGEHLTENDLVFEDVTVSTATANVETDCVDFIGTLSPTVLYEDGAEKTNLYMGSANKLYYPTVEGFKLNACRGYFKLKGVVVNGNGNENAVRSFDINFGEETTGVALMDNGKLIIDNEAGAWYDLSGRKLSVSSDSSVPSVLPKGIYIHNGRKVVVQ